MTTIRTAIVDNHQMFAEGVIEILKSFEPYHLSFTGIFKKGLNFKSYIMNNPVDLILMELSLPDVDGLKLIPDLRAIDKSMKIMVLSSYSDNRFVKKALQSGADGYICKTNSADELKEGIEELVKDRTFIAEGLYITPPPNHVKKQNGFKTFNGGGVYKDRFLIQKRLTKREQEILNLITQAKNNKEIANELYISDQTVGVHRKNIMRKLGVKNTVNLIKFAIEHQLV